MNLLIYWLRLWWWKHNNNKKIERSLRKGSNERKDERMLGRQKKKNDNFNNTLEKVKIKYIQKFNIMSTVGRNGGKYHTENWTRLKIAKVVFQKQQWTYQSFYKWNVVRRRTEMVKCNKLIKTTKDWNFIERHDRLSSEMT